MPEKSTSTYAEESAASLEEAVASGENEGKTENGGADEAPRETPSYVAPGYEVVPASALSASVATLSSPWISGGGTGGGSGSGGSGTGSGSGGDTSASARFKRVLTGHFGFDEDTADIMLRVLSAIESLASSLNDADKHLKAAYVFFRALSGADYSDPQWDATAGDLNAVYKGSLLGESITLDSSVPSKAFFIFLNLSDEEHARLWYEMRLQHQLSGITNAGAAIWLTLDTDGKYKEKYAEAYGLSNVKDSAFRSFWNNRVSTMCVHPDFTHFCATTATHLATSLGYGSVANAGISVTYASAKSYLGGVDNTREALAGWFGDAVLYEDKQADSDRDGVADSPNSPTSKGTSMGWDDYWSDIDALSVAKTLPSNAYDVKLTLASYYGVTSPTSAIACFTRRNNFKRYFNASTAAICIGSTLYDHVAVSTADQAIALMKSDPACYDTYRFLLTLNGAAEGTYGGSEI